MRFEAEVVDWRERLRSADGSIFRWLGISLGPKANGLRTKSWIASIHKGDEADHTVVLIHKSSAKMNDQVDYSLRVSSNCEYPIENHWPESRAICRTAAARMAEVG